MKLYSKRTFLVYRALARVYLRICHPVAHIRGRENIPQGAAVLCGNHSSFSDAIWIVAYYGTDFYPRTMAKKELLQIPVLGKLLMHMGVFPVDRGTSDLGAMQTAMRALRDGDKLLIFPEGTRIRKGKTVVPHNGAMVFATRQGAPVVPVYVTKNKHFLGPVDVIFGEAYTPEFAGNRATPEELDTLTADLMRRIYALGEAL